MGRSRLLSSAAAELSALFLPQIPNTISSADNVTAVIAVSPLLVKIIYFKKTPPHTKCMRGTSF